MNADNRLKALGGLKKTAVERRPAEEQLPHSQQPAAVPLQAVASLPAAVPVPAPEPDPKPAAESASSEAVVEATDLSSRYTSVTLRTPEELDARLVAHHERTRLSYPNIIMNAIDSTYTALPGILSARQHAVPPANLFGRPETVAQLPSDESEKAIRPVRMLRTHVAVIDKIAKALTNNNRTRLINAALDEYLKDERTS